MRYVFLRYGGFISDEVEACTSSVVTSSWQMAVRQTKGSLDIPIEELMEFATHFHIVPNLISTASFETFVRGNLPLSAGEQEVRVSFSTFLDVLTDISNAFFGKSVQDKGDDADPHGHIAAFKELLSIIDPKMVMFHSQPNPQGEEEPGVDESGVDQTDGTFGEGDINPFDTPFDNIDSPTIAKRANPMALGAKVSGSKVSVCESVRKRPEKARVLDVAVSFSSLTLF